MSSARNHAKRSHRSEYMKRSNISHSARRMIIKEAQRPKRRGLFDLIKGFFHQKQPTSN